MKQLLVISCPIDTFSGYGARSRDIVKVLLKADKYDIKIVPQRWGNTPFGFLNAEKVDDKAILDCILAVPQLPKQPDIWIQVTVPNEFQAVGKYNIGITAGIETTLCDASWIEGVNRMNLTLTSSEHAKRVFEGSTFEQRDQQTQQVVRQIRLEKPVEVLFEGVDTSIYQKLDAVVGSDLWDIVDTIDEDFNYLFVGHWLQGEMGQDRKDVGMLVRTFLETFKGKGKKPGLILKISGGTYSIMDRDEMQDRLQRIRVDIGDNGDLPNVYLLHGELTDDEMNELYNHSKVKVHISFTKGEGYGRPLLEASISQKPVIAPNYSGHLDFLKPELNTLIPGQITQIHPSAVVQNMILPESGWFTVDYSKASDILKDVFKNYKNYVDKAKKQSYISRNEFSLEKMGEKLVSILDTKVPKPVALKLPTLRKIQLPQLKKIEDAK
jgi:glycosyltransferase involved in cell wall biosynthesis